MVQGLYAENLRHLANYGIPQSGEFGDRESFRISTSIERSILNFGNKGLCIVKKQCNSN
jgi:hypothetical protein